MDERAPLHGGPLVLGSFAFPQIFSFSVLGEGDLRRRVFYGLYFLPLFLFSKNLLSLDRRPFLLTVCP